MGMRNRNAPFGTENTVDYFDIVASLCVYTVQSHKQKHLR